MRCWLQALALVALQAVVSEQALPEQTQHREWAELGCAREMSARETRVRCSLPAGNLTLVTDDFKFFNIECEPDASGRAGRFRCDELKAVVARMWAYRDLNFDYYVPLTVRRCELTEPLLCALSLPGVTYNPLTLEDVPDLSPKYLDGFELYALNISYKAKNATVGMPPQLTGPTGQNVPRLSEPWPPALQKVVELELTGLDEVAGVLEHLPLLQILTLGGHTIKTINEETFKNLKILGRLHLRTNALKSLPPSLLLPTPDLRNLELSDYQLQYLSREPLRHLQHLEKVTISNENMSELRLEAGIFSNFLKLMELRIVRSGMRAVPADLVRGSRSLFFLSLEDNLLTELPGEMLYQQRDLRTLSLARNRLRSLPYKLFTMIWTLTKLDLSENAIEFLPNNIFEENQSLRTLNLNHNNLQQLEPELLKPMYNLVKLSLAHNVLASVDLAAFADYSELKSVDLSHNVITQLSDSELNLKINAKFDLSNNNISKLFLENLDPIVGEASIILNNNPVVCDCKLFNFVRVLKEPNFARRFYLDHAFCGAPASLSDKLLSTVTVDELICELDTPPCPEHCACTLRPAAARLELDCPAAPSELPPLAPLNATSVHLRLHTVPDDLAALPPEVRLVDISGLGLTVAPRTLSRLDNLTIDIRNNNLTIAPISLLKANAIIRLAGNRFECDCDHRDSIATLELYSTQLEDRAQLQCRNGDRVMRTPAERLCTMRNAIVLGSTMVALGLILAVVGLLAFRYSTEIRLVLRRYEALDFLFEEPPDPTELEEQYDAFVSFTHRDDDFVQDELVPQLEGGRRPLRLCLHYRDWEIGGMIPEQIARSVSESRRTIVVMSREFLVSKWGRMEFRAAHALDRVILLLRGDVLSAAREDPELRAYLTSNTYVHADDPLVWDRVRDAVLRSRRPRPPAVPALPAPPAAPALTQPQPPLPLQS